MPLAWSAAMQDNVALAVYGLSYSSLKADEKKFLDGTWTTGDPGGMAGLALTKVRQFAQWHEQAGVTSAPAAWQHVLECEARALVMEQARPDRVQAAFAQVRSAWDSAISSFTAEDPSAATLGAQTVHYKALRLHVIDHCIRRRRRIYVPVQTIDAAIFWTLNYLWNCKRWNFRRRQVTFTITPNVAVTTDLVAPEAYHSIASTKLYYIDTAGQGQVLSWVDADESAAARAWPPSPSTGRPEWFRTLRHKDLNWLFAPLPDQVYAVKGEAYISAPAAASSATDVTPFDRFPDEFKPAMFDLVLGKVLMHFDQGDETWRRGLDQVDTLLPEYEDRGVPEQVQVAQDAYGDLDTILSRNGAM